MWPAPEPVKASWMVENGADQIANEATAIGSWPEFLGEGSGNRARRASRPLPLPSAGRHQNQSRLVVPDRIQRWTIPMKKVVMSFKEIEVSGLHLYTLLSKIDPDNCVLHLLLSGWNGSGAVILT